jgi:hypothetical protein
MLAIFYSIVCMLIFVESSIYTEYPYYFISISFMGYLTHKMGVKALGYNVAIAFFISMYSRSIACDIIFFVIYTIILSKIFKYIFFDKVNLLFISLVEVVLYNMYIYFFKRQEVVVMYWLKQYIFVFIYNYLFLSFENKISE